MGGRVPDPRDPVAKASAGSNPAPRIARRGGVPPRHAALVRRLESIPPFASARPELEQVVTPADAAVELLEQALAADDLADRSVADLGAGTGRLAIGAALLGASEVEAVEIDPGAVRVGEDAARSSEVAITWRTSDVRNWSGEVDTVVMNPPFGAQHRGADRPFFDRGLEAARRAVYAFALEASRTFIARRAVERGAYVDSTRRVPWELPRVFPHHRHPRRPLAVDLWVIRTDRNR